MVSDTGCPFIDNPERYLGNRYVFLKVCLSCKIEVCKLDSVDDKDVGWSCLEHKEVNESKNTKRD